jgi:hypothetical protein
MAERCDGSRIRDARHRGYPSGRDKEDGMYRHVPRFAGRMTRIVVAVGMLLLTAVLVLANMPLVQATGQAALATPRETSKVVLPELSIDGPALYTSKPIPNQPGTGLNAVIAWTGTDHHLNLMTSSDGIHYSGKITLAETSSARPAVTAGWAGAIAIAWTGTDANHSLNVMYDVRSAHPTKVTLWHESSFTAPALVPSGDGVLLAWSGDDRNHSLNVQSLHVPDLKLGQKTTMWQNHTIASPDLTADLANNNLILSWAQPSSGRIAFATSSNGMTWSAPMTINEWSGSAPSMMGIVGKGSTPGHWLAWTGTGTDTAHHVNVQYTTNFPNWPAADTKAVLGETTLGGPQVGYVGGDQQVLVAWTGTDPTHHLNVAVITSQASGYAVKVYFSKHPDSDSNFAAVFPVNRVSPDLGVATYAVKQLIAGPTAAEAQAGYFTELTGAINHNEASTCGGADFKITLDHRGTTPEAGTATLQFCRTVTTAGVGADARINSELQATLTQFSTIKKAVILTKDGNCFGDMSGQNTCLKP